MSYIGNPPAEAYTNTVKDSFSGDGSTVAFTLSRPSLTNDVRVVVENVIQDPTVAYSVSGTTLTFTSAPPSGTNNIYVVHLGPAIQTAVPPSEISAATTFASNVTVQGAFTSRGIDDNADAVAMTIDSSENVLVGTTDEQPAVNNDASGISLRSIGQIQASASFAQIFNRVSSDGDIAQFRKDGTKVGSIGIETKGFYIDGEASHAGVRFAANAYVPRLNGADDDTNIDLGGPVQRFRDAYLSGGVYLGGTGAANYLDDYEEGTFTPVIQFGTNSVGQAYQIQAGHYTKVGRLVTFSLRVQFTNKGTSTGSARIYGLPFTTQSVSASNTGAYFGFVDGVGANWGSNNLTPTIDPGGVVIQLRYVNSSGSYQSFTNTDFTNTSDLIMGGQIFTA